MDVRIGIRDKSLDNVAGDPRLKEIKVLVLIN